MRLNMLKLFLRKTRMVCVLKLNPIFVFIFIILKIQITNNKRNIHNANKSNIFLFLLFFTITIINRIKEKELQAVVQNRCYCFE